MHPAILNLSADFYWMISPRLKHGPMFMASSTTKASHISNLTDYARAKLIKSKANSFGIYDSYCHVPAQVLSQTRQWAEKILNRDCPDLEEFLAMADFNYSLPNPGGIKPINRS